jgi:hypothetical protein
MNNLSLFLKLPEKKKKTSKRAEVISEIYAIYSSQQQKNFRKKTNWKRYIEWLKAQRIPDSKENQVKFKRSKSFIKEHGVETICYLISGIPTADLYYIASVAKDMENRKMNFSGYLMAHLTNKVKPFVSNNCG